MELCAELHRGGTTPPEGLVRLVRSVIAIELAVMIRPRGGNFTYLEPEIAQMKDDIAMAKDAGADGVVFGLLLSNRAVDRSAFRLLAEFARPLRVTFHRAFDDAADPAAALEDVISCGADRILTSGQRPTAFEGAPVIAELVRLARGRISVMPGAGIHRGNAGEILRRTGVRELHVGAGVRDASGALVDAALVRSLVESFPA